DRRALSVTLFRDGENVSGGIIDDDIAFVLFLALRLRDQLDRAVVEAVASRIFLLLSLLLGERAPLGGLRQDVHLHDVIACPQRDAANAGGAAAHRPDVDFVETRGAAV